MRRRNHDHQPPRYPDPTILLIGTMVSLVIFGIWSSYVLKLDRYANPNPIDYDRDIVYPIPVTLPETGTDYPPILAYAIFGSERDTARMLRVLKSVYHPRNQYLMYLDALTPSSEREMLRRSLESQEEFQAFGNVHIATKYSVINQNGATCLAAVLHASALLLRINADWDWFTALSPSDYPLIPQDDILYMLSSLPRHLNFIEYTNRTYSDENDGKYGVNDIVIDNSIHREENNPILSAQQSRAEPDAFKIYRGSPWMILSRNFTEHCVMGASDNLPRKLLMYFTNVAFPLEYYFHTVLCNTPKFRNTSVNTDLRYSFLNTRNPKVGRLEKNTPHDELVFSTPAVFARSYQRNNPLLEEIDTEILQRGMDGIAPGNWCIEPHMYKTNNHSTDYHAKDYEGYEKRAEYFNNCSSWGSIDSVKPGKYGIFLAEMFVTDPGKRLFFNDPC